MGRINLRATQALGWEDNRLLDLAVDHLTLCRVGLYLAVFDCAVAEQEKRALPFANTAIDGLRQAGQLQYLPGALLTRAWIRSIQGMHAAAKEDLNEAWQIAERGSMVLHLADIHLHRCRLFFREKIYPWKTPHDDLSAAERLINECGYQKRAQELSDAKDIILGSIR